MPALPDRIVVTATGIISSLGTGLGEHLLRIRAGVAGLRNPGILQTVHASEFQMGEVQLDNAALKEGLSLEEDADSYTRTALLSIYAMRDLLGSVDKAM